MIQRHGDKRSQRHLHYILQAPMPQRSRRKDCEVVKILDKGSALLIIDKDAIAENIVET